MSQSLRRVLAIVRKEMWHIMRDWQTLGIIVLLPVLMMFLYGYALTLDMKDLPVIVEDPSPSPESRALINSIDASTLFAVLRIVPAVSDPEMLFKQYHVKAVFRIPPDFSRDIRNGGSAACIRVQINGTDPNTATIIRNVVEPMVQNAVLNILNVEMPKIVTINPLFLYNPEQKSSFFFVPGLIAAILMMISAMLTSLTITKEKERGTLEQLLVSPLAPWEIIAGKIIPYIVLAAIDGTIILFLSRILYGLSVNGSYALLGLAAVVYIGTALSLGLIFSNIARNQQQAMMMVLPATLLPTIILSGFIFPIKSMPMVLQWIAHAVPPTYFLLLIRGIILKGVGIAALWQNLAILACMGLFLFMISVKKFRVKL